MHFHQIFDILKYNLLASHWYLRLSAGISAFSIALVLSIECGDHGSNNSDRETNDEDDDNHDDHGEVEDDDDDEDDDDEDDDNHDDDDDDEDDAYDDWEKEGPKTLDHDLQSVTDKQNNV